MMFGRLSNRESFHDVVRATQALSQKVFYPVFGKYATKSNLSKANNSRDYHIFEKFAYRLIADAGDCCVKDIFKSNGQVQAFEPTTIQLCLNAFKSAYGVVSAINY